MEKIDISVKVENPYLMLGFVQADGVKVSDSSSDFINFINKVIADNTLSNQQDFPRAFQEGIRKLLKYNGFKPTGRNKPASEYLFQSLKNTNAFTFINNIVDINNILSLQSCLPISIIDLDKTSRNIEIRTGKELEKYIFNNSGQVIDIENLICTCDIENDISIPIANAIKDSMKTKVSEHTTEILGIIYSNKDIVSMEKLKQYLNIFEDYLRKYANAERTFSWII